MKQVRSGVIVPSKIIAVDPGASGGIAFTDRGIAQAQPITDDATSCALFRQLSLGAGFIVYMELVGGYIGKAQPGSAMFNFGDGYGYFRGLCDAFNLPLVLVRPQKWMRAVLPGVIGMEYTRRKAALKQYAQERYPGIMVTKATGDALAILDYAERAERGEWRGEAPVARSTNWGRDSREARAWAKEAGYAIPPRSTKEFMEMVNYFVSNIRQ